MENEKITIKNHVTALMRTVKFSCALAEADNPGCKQEMLDMLIGELDKLGGRQKPCSTEGLAVCATEKDMSVSSGLTFGTALAYLKDGWKVARKGWNGKGQYVELAECISYRNRAGNIINADHQAIGNAALAFVGTSGVQLGWLASQADMLAEDWYVVK